MIQAAFRGPCRIGSVLQPPARSPSMSAKSLVEAAPTRKSMKIEPMHHGSQWPMRATIAQPATLSRQPRGMAIVKLASMPRALVRPTTAPSRRG